MCDLVTGLCSHLVHCDGKDSSNCWQRKERKRENFWLFLSASGGFLSFVHIELDKRLFAQKAALCKFAFGGAHQTGLPGRFSAPGLTVNAFLSRTETSRSIKTFLHLLVLPLGNASMFTWRRGVRRSGDASQTSARVPCIFKTIKQTNR